MHMDSSSIVGAGISASFSSNGATRIEYFSQGCGPAIFLLPSLGRSASDFAELSELLSAKGFRVLRPQPRGIGASVGPMEDVTIQDLAADVASVIEAEKLSPVIVAGHAFGNFVTRMLATLRPELVRGIALIAGSVGKVPGKASPFDPEIWESIRKSGDLDCSDQERLVHLQRAFFAPGNDPSVWLSGWHTNAKTMQISAQTLTPADLYFAGGTAPILDIQAEDDTVAPRKYAHILRAELGDRVTTVVVPNAGHALLPEQPAAVCSALATWSAQLG